MVSRFEDYVKLIINNVCSSTEGNHERLLCIVLEEYYLTKGKKFESNSSHGGDFKNDGWVKEDAIFYQIYSPPSFSKSKYENKFIKDLKKLIELIYKFGKWKGNINEYVFVVNRFMDQELPSASNVDFDKLIDDLKEQYSIDFTYKTVTTHKYLFDILYEIKDNWEVLDKISIKLNLLSSQIYSEINHCNVKEFFEILQQQIIYNHYNQQQPRDYKRISSIKKIVINDLEDKRNDIEKHMLKLGIIQQVLDEMSQDYRKSEIFEKVLKTVIDKYLQLQDKYYGIELYNKLIESLLNLVYDLEKYRLLVETLVVFVFDKCDIFKKEEF